jgi:hypothetical protein
MGNKPCKGQEDGVDCTEDVSSPSEGAVYQCKAEKCEFHACGGEFVLDPVKEATCRSKTCTVDDWNKVYDGMHADKKPNVQGFGPKVKGQTFKLFGENDGNDVCVPTRGLFGGNNGTVNCDTFCGGQNGGPWNTLTPPEWKGATCVGTGHFDASGTWVDKTSVVGCSTVRTTAGKVTEADHSIYQCLCEKSDTPWA